MQVSSSHAFLWQPFLKGGEEENTLLLALLSLSPKSLVTFLWSRISVFAVPSFLLIKQEEMA